MHRALGAAALLALAATPVALALDLTPGTILGVNALGLDGDDTRRPSGAAGAGRDRSSCRVGTANPTTHRRASHFAGLVSVSSTRPTSTYWPPPVWLQWTAMVFLPALSVAAASGEIG